MIFCRSKLNEISLGFKLFKLFSKISKLGHLEFPMCFSILDLVLCKQKIRTKRSIKSKYF